MTRSICPANAPVRAILGASQSGIEAAVLVRKTSDGIVDLHIDVGIDAEIAAPRARPNLEASGGAGGTIDEVMAIRVAFGKARAFAGAQNGFAAISHQNKFTRQDVHELVLIAMQMTLARPCPGREPKKIDAKIAQPRRVTERLSHAQGARLV